MKKPFNTTNIPVKTWAKTHAEMFEAGYLACANNEEYTAFQSESWKMGFKLCFNTLADPYEPRPWKGTF